jgi:ferredoxin
MGSLEIQLDQSICCGSGMCASIAPKAFTLMENGLAQVSNTAVGVGINEVIKAAKNCPTMCISLIRDGDEINLF